MCGNIKVEYEISVLEHNVLLVIAQRTPGRTKYPVGLHKMLPDMEHKRCYTPINLVPSKRRGHYMVVFYIYSLQSGKGL